MDSKTLCCPVCFEEFNLAEHLPRVLPICGHSVCSECLSRILYDRYGAKCPLDKKPFSFQQNHIDSFPKNFSVMEVLQKMAHKELCKDHEEQISYICYSDGHKVCDECIWNGSHKGHNIKHLKAIKLEATTQKKEVETLLEEIDVYQREINKTIEENKTAIIKAVKDKFEELRAIIYNKEQEYLFELGCLFNMEKYKTNTSFGKDSELKKSLSQNSNSLTNILQHHDLILDSNFLTENLEYIKDIKVKITKESMEKELRRVNKWFEDIYQCVNVRVMSQIKFWSELEGPFQNPLGNPSNIIEDVRKSLMYKSPESRITSLKIGSPFCFNQNNAHLEIVNYPSTFQESFIDLVKLKEVKSVSLDIKPNTWEEKDVQILNYVWAKPLDPKSLELKMHSDSISNEIYGVLMRGPKSFLEVKIDLEGYQTNDETKVSFFVAKVLSKMINLKSVSLITSKSNLTEKTLYIAQVLDTQNLEKFELFLDETALTDENINKALVPLPNLRSLQLGLRGTRITDRAMELLAKNILACTKDLNEFKLYVVKTEISDNGILPLLSYLKNIRVLHLGLSLTKITDKTLEMLGQSMSAISSSLEEVKIGVNEVRVGDEGLSKIFKAMPKVKVFGLYLCNNITDRSLYGLVQNTLTTIEALEVFEIDLKYTKVQDAGVSSILSCLKNLKQLSLDLSYTGVTDSSINLFAVEKLLSMRDLRKLVIDVSNTYVGFEMQSRIKNVIDQKKELKN